MERRVLRSYTKRTPAPPDIHDRPNPGSFGPLRTPTVIPRAQGPPKKSILDNKKNISQYHERKGKVQWTLWKKREISPGKARKRKRKKSTVKTRKEEEPQTAVADSRIDRTVSQSDSSNSSLGQPPGRFKKKKLSTKKEKTVPKPLTRKKRSVKTTSRKTVAPSTTTRKVKKTKRTISRSSKIKPQQYSFQYF